MSLSKALGLALFLAMLGLLIQTYATSSSQKELTIYKAKCDSLQVVVDSLYGENFPCQIELSRYQMAHQLLRRKNPKAAELYSTIISDETE